MSPVWALAVRYARATKALDIANILGLAIGFASLIVAGLYVTDRWLGPRLLDPDGRVYLLATVLERPGAAPLIISGSAPEAATAIAADLEGVAVARIATERELNLRGEAEGAFDANVYSADAAISGLFNWSVESGDLRRVLERPGGVALSTSAAKAYFGDTSALGRSLRLTGGDEVVVGAIFSDPRSDSLLAGIEALISSRHPRSSLRTSADGIGAGFFSIGLVRTFARLEEGRSARQLEAAASRALDAASRDQLGAGAARLSRYTAKAASAARFAFEPIDKSPSEVRSRKTSLAAVLGLGATLFALSVVNFGGLAAFSSLRLAKDTALRRFAGASAFELGAAFGTWGALCGAAAAMGGLALALVLLSAVPALAGAEILRWLSAPVIAGLAALGLGIGFLSFGLAGLLACRLPLGRALSSRSAAQHSVKGVRLAAAWIQLALAMGLASFAGMVSWQLNFLLSGGLGFASQGVYSLALPASASPSRVEELRAAVSQQPAISAVALSTATPSQGGLLRRTLRHRGITLEDVSTFEVTPAFFEVYRVPVVAGALSAGGTGADGVLALAPTASTARGLGFSPPGYGVGELVRWEAGAGAGLARIVAVTADFPVAELPKRTPSPPTAAILEAGQALRVWSHLSVRFLSDKEDNSARLARVHQRLFPGERARIEPVRERVARAYRASRDLMSFALLFAGTALAVAIAGMAAFSIEAARSYRREAALRLVCGAALSSIVLIQLRRNVLVVGSALLGGGAAGALAGNYWMLQFQDRISGVYAWPILVVLLSAGVCASVLALAVLQIALRQPMASLRSD